MSRSNIVETLIGVVIIAIAAGFLAYAYARGDIDAGKGGYHLTAKFGRVDGVSVGSDVRIAGVKIGSVVNQSLDPKTYLAKVDMVITAPVEIPADSVAKVTMDGLLGGAFVGIEPGAEEDYLKDGEEIVYTQGAVDLVSLATRAFIDSSATKDDSPKADADKKDAVPALPDL